jgi:hypothetical protein
VVCYAVMSCILVGVYQRFQGTCSLHLHGTFETFVYTDKTTWRSNPEGNNLSSHRRINCLTCR